MPADLTGNPRRFTLFTVFYTARAYYPVLAILFVDLGLRLDQYVLLNMIWAGTIFLFEVPSGALADTIGRKKLLVAASVLMCAEMLCLLFAPRNGGTLLLGMCVLNRVFSGLSEACASGADEALAYDSLPAENRAGAWDKLLATTMRWRSAGFVIAMILGGLLYDPEFWNKWLPSGLRISTVFAHRLPVVLVFCQAICCVIVTLGMKEPARDQNAQVAESVRHTFQLTWQTARWVFSNPHTLVVILIGLSIDSIVRNFATLNSSYYRLIELPAWTFGFIGAGMGVIGWFVPAVAKSLNDRFGILANLGIAAVVSLAGLVAVVPAWPRFGLLPAVLLMAMMGYLGFTISKALHREADSARRATVLSVKGLAFNLGYGLFSLAFSRLLAGFPDQPPGTAFRSALLWQVPAFVITLLVLFAWGRSHWKRRVA